MSTVTPLAPADIVKSVSKITKEYEDSLKLDSVLYKTYDITATFQLGAKKTSIIKGFITTSSLKTPTDVQKRGLYIRLGDASALPTELRNILVIEGTDEFIPYREFGDLWSHEYPVRGRGNLKTNINSNGLVIPVTFRFDNCASNEELLALESLLTFNTQVSKNALLHLKQRGMNETVSYIDNSLLADQFKKKDSNLDAEISKAEADLLLLKSKNETFVVDLAKKTQAQATVSADVAKIKHINTDLTAKIEANKVDILGQTVKVEDLQKELETHNKIVADKVKLESEKKACMDNYNVAEGKLKKVSLGNKSDDFVNQAKTKLNKYDLSFQHVFSGIVSNNR